MVKDWFSTENCEPKTSLSVEIRRLASVGNPSTFYTERGAGNGWEVAAGQRPEEPDPDNAGEGNVCRAMACDGQFSFAVLTDR